MPSASSETDVYGLFPEIWPNKYIKIFNVKCSDVPHNQWETIYNNHCTSLHCFDAVTYFLFVHFLCLPHEFTISLPMFNGVNAMTHEHTNNVTELYGSTKGYNPYAVIWLSIYDTSLEECLPKVNIRWR